ncbi:MAG TPA: 50S ribosomal protein L20 [Elusimicrobiales bacterium]|nr:50S ribosomal protein L20 [Elusimicrobiales bacterium]
MRTRYTTGKNKRKKKLFKFAKGYRSEKSKRLRMVTQQVEKSLTHSFTGRKDRKGDFRSLWIMRINAAVRELDMNYSQFIHGLAKAGITLNRKMLSEMAIKDPNSFNELVKVVKSNK